MNLTLPKGSYSTIYPLLILFTMHLFSSPDHSPCIRLRDQLKICSQTVCLRFRLLHQSKTNNVQIYKPASLLILSCYTDQSDLAHFTWFFKKKSYMYGAPTNPPAFLRILTLCGRGFLYSLTLSLSSLCHACIGRGLPV